MEQEGKEGRAHGQGSTRHATYSRGRRRRLCLLGIGQKHYSKNIS